MRRIRTRYSIYYPLPESKPGAHRSIRVELKARLEIPRPRQDRLHRQIASCGAGTRAPASTLVSTQSEANR